MRARSLARSLVGGRLRIPASIYGWVTFRIEFTREGRAMKSLRTMMGFLAMALVVAGCSGFNNNDTYVDAKASKGELEFVNQCMRDRVDCRWLRWTQIDDFTYRLVDTYAFRGDITFAEFNDWSWCEGLQHAGVRFWGGGEDRAYDYESAQAGRCVVRIPSKSLTRSWYQRLVGMSPGYHFLRLYKTDSSRVSNYRINTLFRFGNATTTTTRAIFQSAPGLTLYGESTLINGRVIQPFVRDGHGYVLDFTSKPNAPLVKIGMSAYSSWQDYAADYMKVWTAKVLQPATRAADVVSSLTQSSKEFAALGLSYKITTDSWGQFPPSVPADILERKSGDCKDLAVVMASILAKHGLAAQPVLIRASDGPEQTPSLKRIPLLSWPNHILLYLPDAGVYIDPTLKGSNYVVGESYPAYRHVGVNLGTGHFVVLGEKP